MTASNNTPKPTPLSDAELAAFMNDAVRHRADLVREFLMHKKFYTAHDVSQDPAYAHLVHEVRARWLPDILARLDDNDALAVYRALWPLTQRTYTADPAEFWQILEMCELDWTED